MNNLTYENIRLMFRGILHDWEEKPRAHTYWSILYTLVWKRPHSEAKRLTEEFGIFLEDAMMEQVQEDPPTGHGMEQVLEDWNHLFSCYGEPPVNAEALYLYNNMSRFTNTGDTYLDYRTQLMEEIAPMGENDKNIVHSVLRQKLAALLIQAYKEEGGNKQFLRIYRLWRDVQTCLREGAGEFALYFIRPVSDGARLFSPWTVNQDSTVEEFFYAAAVTGDLRQSGRAWGCQAPLVKKLYKPLTQRVFRMVKNGVESEDSRALLELYVMLSWTVDGENWDYWTLKRFGQFRERYCPPLWYTGDEGDEKEDTKE